MTTRPLDDNDERVMREIRNKVIDAIATVLPNDDEPSPAAILRRWLSIEALVGLSGTLMRGLIEYEPDAREGCDAMVELLSKLIDEPIDWTRMDAIRARRRP